MTMKLMPGTKAPGLKVAILDGTEWDLSQQNPSALTLIVVFRGLHCPICKDYLNDLNQKMDEFRQLGVDPIAVSVETKERAEKLYADWGIENVPVGYGLMVEQMRDWGVYISPKAFENEPPFFAEPALFMVQPGGTLYHVAIMNAPYGRPPLTEFWAD